MLAVHAADLALRSPHLLVGAPTPTVGTIRGGTVSCMVPALCEIGVDRRLIPGEDPEQAIHDIEKAVAGTGVSWDLEVRNRALPSDTDPTIPLAVALLRRAAEVNGYTTPIGLPMITDGHILVHRAHIPTILYGPGDL